MTSDYDLIVGFDTEYVRGSHLDDSIPDDDNAVVSYQMAVYAPSTEQRKSGVILTEGLYYSWSKEFLEAGKRRLAGDTARAATSSEVTELRRQSRSLKEVVAEQALELRLLKKSMIADGEDGQ